MDDRDDALVLAHRKVDELKELIESELFDRGYMFYERL